MKRVKGQIFNSDGKYIFGELEIEKDKIISVNELNKEDLSDEEKSRKVIPGLIDIHMHGAAGKDICRCSMDELETVVEYEKRHGITSICPATMTLEENDLLGICKKVAECAKRRAEIKGIYLEGPFISYGKAGAQNPKHIRKPDIKLIKRLNAEANNLIKVVTVAPECEGAMQMINQIKEDDICTVSLAHTEADYRQAADAFETGASHVTHLYNGMNPMLHREPGVPGAAADDEKVTVELICDGIHVDPVMIRNTFRLFGRERVILISDSMEATGMEDGDYMLGDCNVKKQGNKATLPDGTIAGSVTNLYQCMLNAMEYGIDEVSAIMAATKNPAKRIGIFDKVGSIEAGKNADIIIVDEKYKLLQVIQSEKDIIE